MKQVSVKQPIIDGTVVKRRRRPKIELTACPHCGGSDVHFFRGVETCKSVRKISYFVGCRTCLTIIDQYSTREAAASYWRTGCVFWVRIASSPIGWPQGRPRWEQRLLVRPAGTG